MRKRVYVAGPITLGSRPDNIRNAILAGERLYQAGYVPYIPHLNELWAVTTGNKTHEEWLAYDFAWLDLCHAMVRLPGDSSGCVAEEAFARSAMIPVYPSVGEFLAAEGCDG